MPSSTPAAAPMTEPELGEFSTHTRVGDHVVKRLHSHHPAGARFLDAVARNGVPGLRSYLGDLQRAEVALPGELTVLDAEPLTIWHRWVPGPTLLTVASSHAARFTSSIVQIGQWVERLKDADARIDANLANFCLTSGGPVLIDVLPPLIPSMRPEPRNLFEELFAALCFDTPTTLDALAGYALRVSLRTAGLAAAADLAQRTRDMARNEKDSTFPARWFGARRALATRAARGETDTDIVHEFFALTSVLRFRQLTERGRHAQIDYVEQRMQELEL